MPDMTDDLGGRRVATHREGAAHSASRQMTSGVREDAVRGDELVGAKVAHFSIRRKLGAGGMGVVYEAYDETLGRTVALKMLLARDEDVTQRARFLREARAASRIQHPNVATIYEVGDTPLGAFIALEFVPGETMRAWLRSSPPFVDRLRVARAVAEAVGTAHAAGVVHRDLKPENVMITEAGVAKVLDFGLAKHDERGVGDAPTSDETKTAAGVIMGTPSYMSPEQVRGETVDARSDVFSLGVVLYEAFTGRRPFAGDSAGAIILAMGTEPPTPRALAPDVPRALEKIIVRCLAKKPEERYADAHAVAVALADVPAEAAGSRRRAIAFALAGMAIVAVGAVFTRGSAPPPATLIPPVASFVPSASGSAPLRVAPLEALPSAPTPSASADVDAALHDAVVAALRRGDDDERAFVAFPCRAFEEATRLEPAFTTAALRLAACRLAYEEDVPSARAAFQEGGLAAAAATLGERDRAFVEALAPLFARGDGVAAAEATSRVAARYSSDGEVLAAAAGLADVYLPGRDRVRALYTQLGAVEPKGVLRFARLARLEREVGNADAAIQAATACAALGPSPECTLERSANEAASGACSAAESTVQGALTAAPGLLRARVAHAGLVAGRDMAAARAELEVDAGASSAPLLPWARASLDALRGDFDAIAARAREPNAFEGRLEGRGILLVLHALRESGRDDEAVRYAIQTLTRYDRAPETAGRVVKGPFDALGTLDAVRRRADPLFEGAREQRLAFIKGEAGASLRAAWLAEYAVPARTEDEAKLALGREADGAGPALPQEGAVTGRVAALAKVPGAGRTLAAAMSSCDAFRAPFERTEGAYFVGQEAEATGQVAAACTAYRALVAKWGSATPQSMTARKARARIGALRCPPE